MKPETKTAIISAALSLIVGLIIAVFTYYIGKTKGSEGKKPGFDQITTQINLDKTKWQVSYEDIPPQSPANQPGPANQGAAKNPGPVGSPSPPINVATVEFNQYGSRIIGEGRDNQGRRWIVEGAAAERRVCYIYFDPGGQRLSFGTVLLVMDNSGTQMMGQWTGWGPGSNDPQPRKVTLTKL